MTDIVWKTVTLPDAVLGVLYEAGLAFTGNATAITAAAVATGALPGGVTLNADHVRLTGTPDAVGAFTFTLTLTDTAGAVTSGSLSIRVRDSLYATPNTVNNDSPTSQIYRQWPLQIP